MAQSTSTGSGTARPDVVVLVGNPRARSRTRTVGEIVARRVAARLGLTGEAVVVDLADHAPDVLAPSAPAVEAALARVASAQVVVVATPVYKGSYTGLLKAFVDRYAHRPLAGVLAVPVVVSASPGHASAGDLHLLPLLAELGADVPASSFSVVEAQLEALDGVDEAVARWLVDTGLPAVRGVPPEGPVAGVVGAAVVGAGA